MPKLVRDNVIKLMRSEGKEPKYDTLNDEQFRAALGCKVREEAQELALAQTRDEVIEESADLLEALLALLHEEGVDITEVHAARVRKARYMGTFDERIFLHGDAS